MRGLSPPPSLQCGGAEAPPPCSPLFLHPCEGCDYGVLKDEMLRDRLVVDIRDTAVSEKLQLNAILTLREIDKAERSCSGAVAAAAGGRQP